MPGKKLPGHMGVVNMTVKNLEVVEVRPDQNLLFVRGAVPAASTGSFLSIRLIKKEKYRGLFKCRQSQW